MEPRFDGSDETSHDFLHSWVLMPTELGLPLRVQLRTRMPVGLCMLDTRILVLY